MGSSRRAWTMGEPVELDPEAVSEHAIARMRFQVNSLNLAFPFDCDTCGAERLGNFNDPGLLSMNDYTCADALGNKQCRRPQMPRKTKRPLYFLPGSLVNCHLPRSESELWPGMVDYCPDGVRDYHIGGNGSGEEEAYFVILISRDKSADRAWVGGFFPASELVPFEYTGIPPGASPAYIGALEVARKASADRLTQRLAQLSFIVHAAKLRGRPIQIDVRSMELDPSHDEQKSSSAESAQDSKFKEPPKKKFSQSQYWLPSRVPEKPLFRHGDPGIWRILYGD